MHQQHPQNLQEFRVHVRQFLETHFTPELRAEARRQTGVFAEAGLARKWQEKLALNNWVAPLWPKEYGGPGWSIAQRHVFDSECALAGTPVLPAFGIQLVGPVLINRGTKAQKDYFLPRILNGEHYWCQGFSEPQSGSDLAALTSRAIREGDHYVVNGSKIWTTHAHFANWIFVLVRTSNDGPKQSGITFLLIDLESSGISVEPIYSISGDHEFNQVFFDNVQVPLWQRVGEENDGWNVAKFLLEFERGAGDWSARIQRCLHSIGAAGNADPTAPLDEAFHRRRAALEIDAYALEATEARLISSLHSGETPGNTYASLLKLKGSETYQRATELVMEAAGPYGCLSDCIGESSSAPPAGDQIERLQPCMPRYLNARATTIYGGSSEIQKNILSKIILA